MMDVTGRALFLDEACVRQLVTMEDALAAVEEVFGAQGRGGVFNVPRVCAPVKGGILRITAAVLSYRGYYGVKVSSTAVFHSNAGRMFCLYREETGELCAVVQVFAMGAPPAGSPKPAPKPSPNMTPMPANATAMATQVDIATGSLRKMRPNMAVARGEMLMSTKVLAVEVCLSARMNRHICAARQMAATAPAAPTARTCAGTVRPCARPRSRATKSAMNRARQKTISPRVADADKTHDQTAGTPANAGAEHECDAARVLRRRHPQCARMAPGRRLVDSDAIMPPVSTTMGVLICLSATT